MKCCFTRLRMVCLSLTLHFCLQSHTRWSCCMIPVQTLQTQAWSLLLKLVSVTLHEWSLWLCQKAASSASFYPLTPIHADTLQHPPPALLGCLGISGLCSTWQHRRGSTSHTQTHLCTLQTACSAAASLTSWLIISSIFRWQHTLLPEKLRKKSYL